MEAIFHQIADLASETLTAFIELETEEEKVSIATNLSRAAQPQKNLLNKKELAERLGVSVRTVSELQTEDMPTVLLGKRRIQFDYDEVLIWLKGRRVKGRGKQSCVLYHNHAQTLSNRKLLKCEGAKCQFIRERRKREVGMSTSP